MESESEGELFPTEADIARVFRDLADYAKEVTGETADVTVRWDQYGYPWIKVAPHADAPFIPLPGWLRWGERVRTAPYS